jgi:tRNA nucleotidyltransferase/poly(A) polymerase
MDISKKILSDPINRWVFKSAQKLNTEAFLVGGYVRDLLRGVKSKDKDFVLENNVKDIAIETAKKFNGTFIVLKPQKTFRIVLKNKEIIDFSLFEHSIKDDLKRRDFTVNAIAWSPVTGIIDPFKGRYDLKKHIVKGIRIRNFIDDPLRIIRAYRIASELGFKIENHTRKYLKRYSRGLAKVASERITEEIFKLLSNERAIGYLNECYKDMILNKIFFPQGKKIDSLSKNIKLLNRFDSFLKTQLGKINERKKISKPACPVGRFLKEEISQGLKRLGLIRLALLTKDISISHTRLRVSKTINKAVKDIHNAMEISTGKIPDRELYKIFNASGERVYEMIFLYPFIKRKNIKDILRRVNEYTRIKNTILLNGNDIQRILKIKPGIKVGKILRALHEQQFKGLIKTKAEAESWLLSNFT